MMSEQPYIDPRRAIPARFLVKCDFYGKDPQCPGDLDTRAEGVFQGIAFGYVMNRSGGGAHAVSLLVRKNDSWAHRHCVERATAGLGGQKTLF